MFSIRTNVASLGAQRALSSNSGMLAKSMEKLSSGFRINRAGDDAAGLAISEKLKAQISGLNQASRNASDGISMIQTAEGGLDEVQSIMQRMRELAVQGSNDTLGNDERVALNNELQELHTEVQNISKRTSFNNQGLLRGTLSSALSTDTTATTLTIASGTSGTQTTTGSTLSKIDISRASGDATGIGYTFAYDSTADTLTATGTNGFSEAVTLASTAADVGAHKVSFADLGITLKYTAVAAETVDEIGAMFDAQTVTVTGSNVAKLQTGSGEGEETSITFIDTRLTEATSGTDLAALESALTAFNTDKSQTNASALIGATDDALTFISKERARLGAAQNRLEHTIANVKGASENLSASNSRIRDVDVASESAEMARSNILMQAGVSVLAQANQMTQLSLKLLG